MYASSMKSETVPLAVPLAMPPDLLRQIRHVAKNTGLSMADAMRQSMRLGLPKLAETLSMEQVLRNLKPMTKQEIRQCYQEPNPEFDALEHYCASLPQPLPEED